MQTGASVISSKVMAGGSRKTIGVNCGTAVFDELRQGVRRLEFLVEPTAGELLVGCNETLAAGFVSAVIEQLSRQYPRVAVHVVSANRDVLLTRELPHAPLILLSHRYPD